MFDQPTTTIEFNANEVFLLSSILRFVPHPLTTTSHRLIRPLFNLISAAAIPFQKKIREVSDNCTSIEEIVIDGQKVKQPKLDENKLNQEFGKYMIEQKENLLIVFNLENNTDPLTVAIKYFITQVWVNITVPPDQAELFNRIDEKFCVALPVLGKLIAKDKSTTPVPNEK